MKGVSMTKFFKILTIITALLFCLPLTANAAVDINGSSVNTRMGDEFNLEIVANGSPEILGIEVTIKFDTSYLELKNATGYNNVTANSPSDETVNLVYLDMQGNTLDASNEIKLADIRFSAKKVGQISLDFEKVNISDAEGNDIGGNITTSNITIVDHGDPTKFSLKAPTSDVTVDDKATITVQLQDEDGNVVTSNDSDQVTVNADSGTLSSQPVQVENGVANATLSKQTPGTVQLSLEDTQDTEFDVSSTAEVTFTHGAADKTEVNASATTIASDKRGSTQLTAQIMDQYGNPCTTDNSTSVEFKLSNSTYVQFTDENGDPVHNDSSDLTETVNATNGLASIYVTSKDDKVGEKQHINVNATTDPSTTVTGTPLELSVVDFSLEAVDTVLETGEKTLVKVFGAPEGDSLTQLKDLSAGSLGEFSYNSTGGFYQATYTPGKSAGRDTLQVESTSLDATTNELTLDVYTPVSSGSGFDQETIDLEAGSAASFTVSGGDADNRTWSVTAPDGSDATSALSVDGDTGTFTAPRDDDYAGKYTVKVEDTTLGESLETKVYVPLGAVTVAKDYVLTNSTVNCTVAGASDGITWSVLDADDQELSNFSGYTDENGSSINLQTPEDLDQNLPFKVCAVKDDLSETKSCSEMKTVVLPVDRVHVSASPTTVASNGLGKAVITAKVQDKNKDVRSFDNSTSVTFQLSSDEYVYFAQDTDNNSTMETVNATGGIASIEIKSQNGTVDEEKTVNATVIETNPNATISYADEKDWLEFKVVNFSLEAEDKVLETGEETQIKVFGAPEGDSLSQVNDLSAGSLSGFSYNSTGGFHQATYTAESKDSDELRVRSAEHNDETNAVTIDVYKQLKSGTGFDQDGLDLEAGADTSFTVSGGDSGNREWSVKDPDGNYMDSPPLSGDDTDNTRTFTAPDTGDYAGVYTVSVNDKTLGKTKFTKVYVPLGEIKRDKANVVATDTDGIDFEVKGASTGITWKIVDEEGTSISGIGNIDANSTMSNSTEFIPNGDVGSKSPFYVQAYKDDLRTKSVSDVCRVIPVDEYTVSLTSDGISVTEEGITVFVGEQSNATNTDGKASFRLPDTGGTYLYEVEDKREDPQFLDTEKYSRQKSVQIELETREGSLNGTVEEYKGIQPAVLQANNTISNATVTAYQPEDLEKQYTDTTDSNGTFAIYVPGTYEIGWTVTASKEGYKTEQVEDHFTTEKIIFELKPKTQIESVNATEMNGTVKIQVTAQPNIDESSDVEVKQMSGNGRFATENATVDNNVYSVSYTDTDEFKAQISVETVTNMPDQAVFIYTGNEKAEFGLVDSLAGGRAEFADTDNNQNCTASVPAGKAGKAATMMIRQVKKTKNATTTKGSPEFIYEINLVDEDGNDLGSDDVEYVELTLPIDLSMVEPGSLEDGDYVIYYASSASELESGDGEEVPADNILSTDYVGDGNIGSVRFWVDHLTSFAVGSSSTDDDSSGDDTSDDTGGDTGDDTGGDTGEDSDGDFSSDSGGSSGSCMINTNASFGWEWMLILMLPVVTRLWMRRQR